MKIWLTVLIILSLGQKLAEGRGGRGFGRRSGSRGFLWGRSRFVSTYSSSRISSTTELRIALVAGTIYGASRWRKRTGYRNDGKLPEVCYNDKYKESEDGKGTWTFGRFVCPLNESQSDAYTYCCGEEGKQSCCTFWDDAGRKIGVIVGVTLGIVIMVTAVITVLVLRWITKRRKGILGQGKPQDNVSITSEMTVYPSQQNEDMPMSYKTRLGSNPSNEDPVSTTTPCSSQTRLTAYHSKQNDTMQMSTIPSYEAATGRSPGCVDMSHLMFTTTPYSTRTTMTAYHSQQNDSRQISTIKSCEETTGRSPGYGEPVSMTTPYSTQAIMPSSRYHQNRYKNMPYETKMGTSPRYQRSPNLQNRCTYGTGGNPLHLDQNPKEKSPVRDYDTKNGQLSYPVNATYV